MQITVQFETYQQMLDFCERMVGKTEEVQKPKKAKTAKPKAEPKPKPEPVVEPVVEAPTETAPTVTREELMKYIQENCADNIQPLMDMLDRMGYQRVSMIPDEKLGEALNLLKGE